MRLCRGMGSERSWRTGERERNKKKKKKKKKKIN